MTSQNTSPSASDDLAPLDIDRLREAGTRPDERMELTALPAGIDVRRKVAQEPIIEVSPGKGRRKLRRIDTCQHGSNTAGNHLASQFVRWSPPERKKWPGRRCRRESALDRRARRPETGRQRPWPRRPPAVLSLPSSPSGSHRPGRSKEREARRHAMAGRADLPGLRGESAGLRESRPGRQRRSG